MERVQLDELSLRDFRNIERVRIEPGCRFNIFSGENGAGKTNVVEAIYMLGALRSFRTSAREELVRHGREMASVDGLFAGATAGLRCGLTLTAAERRVTVDGVSARPDGSHFRTLPMVLFHPGNLELVQGGPPSRRRFVDRALFQADQAYPGLLRDYNRALRNRNRLLKDRPLDRRAIAPFDEQLGELGTRVCRARRALVERLTPLFETAFAEVSGTSTATMRYRPSHEGGAEELLAALGSSMARDAERGFTSVGPHADDLSFCVDSKEAKRFASQGQQRAVALALKIAETRALSQINERIPLLLLDDVSSELDERRNARLFAFLDGVGGQVFITSTHRETILVDGQRTDFEVVGGRVERGAVS